MSDLVAFLTARLDEDEARVKYTSPSPWQASPRGMYVDDARGNRLAQLNFTEDGQHIARHDPARVLREVAAKRAILVEIESELADDPTVVMPQDRLRILVAVYSDHPDYRQEWKL